MKTVVSISEDTILVPENSDLKLSTARIIRFNPKEHEEEYELLQKLFTVSDDKDFARALKTHIKTEYPEIRKVEQITPVFGVAEDESGLLPADEKRIIYTAFLVDIETVSGGKTKKIIPIRVKFNGDRGLLIADWIARSKIVSFKKYDDLVRRKWETKIMGEELGDNPVLPSGNFLVAKIKKGVIADAVVGKAKPVEDTNGLIELATGKDSRLALVRFNEATTSIVQGLTFDSGKPYFFSVVEASKGWFAPLSKKVSTSILRRLNERLMRENSTVRLLLNYPPTFQILQGNQDGTLSYSVGKLKLIAGYDLKAERMLAPTPYAPYSIVKGNIIEPGYSEEYDDVLVYDSALLKPRRIAYIVLASPVSKKGIVFDGDYAYSYSGRVVYNTIADKLQELGKEYLVRRYGVLIKDGSPLDVLKLGFFDGYLMSRYFGSATLLPGEPVKDGYPLAFLPPGMFRSNPEVVKLVKGLEESSVRPVLIKRRADGGYDVIAMDKKDYIRSRLFLWSLEPGEYTIDRKLLTKRLNKVFGNSTDKSATFINDDIAMYKLKRRVLKVSGLIVLNSKRVVAYNVKMGDVKSVINEFLRKFLYRWVDKKVADVIEEVEETYPGFLLKSFEATADDTVTHRVVADEKRKSLIVFAV